MREREEGGRRFKRIHNQMGEARPLNLLNIAAWLISICLYFSPFCLRLGDRALAPCVLARVCTCKGKDKKPTDKQWKEKMKRAHEGDIKQISMIDTASVETRMRVNKQ